MRTEKEMLDLIIETAQKDERIRAAYLEGSRANPNAPKDIFQDYDVEYIVNETRPFREDRKWIDRFGERLYMQFPDEGPYDDADVENWYGWLMQLADGNRLDLHVITWEKAKESMDQYIVLVDKDHLFDQKENLTDKMYWIKKPDQKEFSAVCNEFWWCLNNIAKGQWRQEIPYVMDILNDPVRPMLRRLLEWKIGAENHFSVSAGKSGKYMKAYLPDCVYRQYLATYPPARTREIWDSVFILCDLFDQTAREVSGKLHFIYDFAEAKNSRSYLEHVKELPADAEEIY